MGRPVHLQSTRDLVTDLFRRQAGDPKLTRGEPLRQAITIPIVSFDREHIYLRRSAIRLPNRPIEDGMATLVVAQMLFLEAENPKKEISMYINSPGGLVTSGLAIYDTMQFIRPPVSTLCCGQAASMGSLLLAAGAKDLRFALPNVRVMIHQPSGGFEGQVTDIMLHAQEILNLKKRLNEIYVHHTGQPIKKIEDALERDYFLTAEAANDFGLVDKVITKRPEEAATKPQMGAKTTP